MAIRTLKNLSLLSILKIFELGLPIVIYPYVISVVGLENYGEVVFAQSIISYLTLFANYGFTTSGSRDIALIMEDIVASSRYVSTLYLVKIALWSIGIIVVGTFVLYIESTELIFLLLFSLTISLSEVIRPTWLYIGYERADIISVFGVLKQVLTFGLYFVVLTSSEDYILIPLIPGISGILIYSIALVYGVNKFNLHFAKVNRSIFLKVLSQNFPIFVSSVSTKSYIILNKVIIGSVLNTSMLGAYDLAEKVINIAKIPIQILGQILLPIFTRQRSINNSNRWLKASLFLNCISATLIYFFSENILRLLYSRPPSESIEALRIFSLTLPLFSISMFLGGLRLLPYGYDRFYLKSMVITLVTYLVLVALLLLFNLESLKSFVMASVVVEILAVLILLFGTQKYKILYEPRGEC